MEQVELEAKIRKEFGKSAARKIRQRGDVPAVLYGGREEPLGLEFRARDLERILRRSGGENIVLNLKLTNVEGQPVKAALIKDLQRDPIKGNFLHADLYRISMMEKLSVNVPLEVVGEAIGVKEGGILEHLLWEVKIESLPSQIPKSIKVDISNLKLGGSLHVRDLKVEDEVRILEDPERVVVTIGVPAAIAVEKVAEAPVTEPELIGRKKEEVEVEEKVKPEEVKETKPEERKEVKPGEQKEEKPEKGEKK